MVSTVCAHILGDRFTMASARIYCYSRLKKHLSANLIASSKNKIFSFSSNSKTISDDLGYSSSPSTKKLPDDPPLPSFLLLASLSFCPGLTQDPDKKRKSIPPNGWKEGTGQMRWRVVWGHAGQPPVS